MSWALKVSQVAERLLNQRYVATIDPFTMLLALNSGSGGISGIASTQQSLNFEQPMNLIRAQSMRADQQSKPFTRYIR